MPKPGKSGDRGGFGGGNKKKDRTGDKLRSRSSFKKRGDNDDSRRARRSDRVGSTKKSNYYKSSSSNRKISLWTDEPRLSTRTPFRGNTAFTDASPFSGKNPFDSELAQNQQRMNWLISQESKKKKKRAEDVEQKRSCRIRKDKAAAAFILASTLGRVSSKSPDPASVKSSALNTSSQQKKESISKINKQHNSSGKDSRSSRLSLKNFLLAKFSLKNLSQADIDSPPEKSGKHKEEAQSELPNMEEEHNEGPNPNEEMSASRRSLADETNTAEHISETPTNEDVEKSDSKSRSQTLRDYKDPLETDPEGPGCCSLIITLLSYLLVIVTMPLSLCFCIKVVQEYERAVIFRLGRLLQGGAKGPGIFFIVPCIDTYRKVDLRTVSFDVPPQEILTRDSVTVAVDAVVYYRILDPTVAVTNIENFSHSTRLLAATTLRNVLGTKSLADLLAERESISQQMQSTLDEATDPWGVKVERVEIKDVRLPVQLQRAMAAEAEAAREARAKVIAAEGEQRASRALKEAADVMSESPSALQLRYLQTLSTISAEKNSTIVFPLPIDVLSQFLLRK